MKIQKIYDFYKTDYTARFLNVLRQRWKDGKEWSCVGFPKKQHLFLYLDGLSATYVDEAGNIVEGKSGDLVYAPIAAQYKVKFHSSQSENASTLGLNFSLFDELGEAVSLSRSVKNFGTSPSAAMLLQEAERLSYSAQNVPVKNHALLYNLLSKLGESVEGARNKNNFKLIEKGLEYLTARFNEDTSVEELAAVCNISEVYFRKLFKHHTGKTPTRYRIDLRLAKAKHYLQYSDIPIGELSELLGYSDTAYFIKQFKDEFSVSPFAYRMKTKL